MLRFSEISKNCRVESDDRAVGGGEYAIVQRQCILFPILFFLLHECLYSKGGSLGENVILDGKVRRPWYHLYANSNFFPSCVQECINENDHRGRRENSQCPRQLNDNDSNS